MVKATEKNILIYKVVEGTYHLLTEDRDVDA